MSSVSSGIVVGKFQKKIISKVPFETQNIAISLIKAFYFLRAVHFCEGTCCNPGLSKIHMSHHD